MTIEVGSEEREVDIIPADFTKTAGNPRYLQGKNLCSSVISVRDFVFSYSQLKIVFSFKSEL